MHAKITGLSITNNIVSLHFGYYSPNTDPNADGAVQLGSWTYAPQATDTADSIAQRVKTNGAQFEHLGQLYDQFAGLVGEVIDV